MLMPLRTRHVSELESSGCQSCDCFRSAHVIVSPLLLKAPTNIPSATNSDWRNAHGSPG